MSEGVVGKAPKTIYSRRVSMQVSPGWTVGSMPVGVKVKVEK